MRGIPIRRLLLPLLITGFVLAVAIWLSLSATV
jgi:hypothetical protein